MLPFVSDLLHHTVHHSDLSYPSVRIQEKLEDGINTIAYAKFLSRHDEASQGQQPWLASFKQESGS